MPKPDRGSSVLDYPGQLPRRHPGRFGETERLDEQSKRSRPNSHREALQVFIHFEKSDENGKTVRAVKLLDYSGSCERPFDLPLRENVLWKSARYADLHGEFPDGESLFPKGTVERNGAPSGEAVIAPAVLERVRLSCGKCHWCANQRKRRWERAATGWVEQSPLTLFGTLTFSDEYFSSEWNQWIDAELDKGEDGSMYSFEDLVHMRTDRFDPQDGEHDAFMRLQLCEERKKLMKRLRDTLQRAAEADPAMSPRLKAHLAVYEYGDLRGRLHMHFLMHFDLDQMPVGTAYSQLRRFLKKHWDQRGIGFVDVQHATPETGAESAKYLCQYLIAYQEEQNQKRVTKSRSRLACSNGYRSKGTDFYFGARPSLIPGGSLRPADPIPLDVEKGFPASWVDVDVEDLYLSEASQKLTFEELPHDFRVLAEQLAKARLAHNTGELWPGWSAGLERDEDDWAEVPDGEFNFAAWILARYWKKNDTFRKVGDGEGDEPPWSIDQGGVSADCLLNLTNNHALTAGIGEVLGKPVSQRAGDARGLTPDTVIRRDGSYRAHPDEVLRQRQRYVRNPADGTVYDPSTGEIIDDQ